MRKTEGSSDANADFNEELIRLLDRYHAALDGNLEYADSTKGAMKSHATTFVEWCHTGDLAPKRFTRSW